MNRYRTLLVHASEDSLRCSLVTFDEIDVFTWKGITYSAVPDVVAFYDYLRATQSGEIVGVELHLAIQSYDAYLSRFRSFEKLPPMPTVPHPWRLWFRREPAEIPWDQTLTANPYLGENRDVIVLLSLSELRDHDYDQLQAITCASECC